MALERRHRSAAASAGDAGQQPASTDWSGCSRSRLGHRAQRRLLLARDRLGIKPLYYRLLPDGIAFASELKALLLVIGAGLGRPPQIDHSAVRDFSVSRLHPRAEDHLSRHREAARRAHADLAGRRGSASSATGIRRPRSSRAAPARPCERTGCACCARSCRQHTLSDVPVGVFLSGGIDSALTTYYLERPRTYTLGFDVGRALRGGCGAPRGGAFAHRASGDDGAAGGFRGGARANAGAVRRAVRRQRRVVELSDRAIRAPRSDGGFERRGRR